MLTSIMILIWHSQWNHSIKVVLHGQHNGSVFPIRPFLSRKCVTWLRIFRALNDARPRGWGGEEAEQHGDDGLGMRWQDCD
jgi:hypothetical protein